MTLTTTIDIDPDITGRIAVWTDFRLKDRVKAVPGAKWSVDHRRWHVPLTWPSCLALRAELGEGLKIEPDLAAWAWEQRDLHETLATLRTQLDGVERPVLPGFPELYPFQVVGAKLVQLAEQYAFVDETGAGKSRTALAGLSLLLEEGETIFPLLVVAPKSMLPTWRDEIDRFFPGAKVSIASGTPAKVRAALAPGAECYVMSYDTLRRYSRHAPYPTVKLKDDEKTDKEVQALGLVSIIADECHRVKNPASQQTRALWAAGQGTRFRIPLTGTPIQDTPEDMWAILHFAFPDEYPTKTSYVDRFLEVSVNRWGAREIKGLHPARGAELLANLDTRVRRITKEVALPFLPPKVFSIRWVELPPAHRKAYDSMVDTLTAPLAGTTSVLRAKSPLERAGRLVQLANATGEVDAAGEFRMKAPSPKVDAFMDDVMAGDFDGQQVVVFSDSRQLLELLDVEMTLKKVKHVVITGAVTGDDRQEAIDTFQAGDAQFILITRAGGEGITLTAASTMARLVRPWSSIVWAQSEDRVHRIGSEKHSSVSIIDYLVEDTVEEGQLVRFTAKGVRAQEVLRDDELLELVKARVSSSD